MGVIKVVLLLKLTLVAVTWCKGADNDKGNSIWTATATDRLKQDIFKKYDKFARPAEGNQTIDCKLSLTILHLEVNELKSTVTLYSFVKMNWQDYKLRWNASHYDGVDIMRVGEHEIWQPDIVLYNDASPKTENYGHTNLLVYNNGQVIWVPPAELSVFCEMDLTYWPYDTQNCSFVLGSWTHHGLDLNVDMAVVAHELEFLVKNSQWLIKNVSVSRHDKIYACCEESYPDVTYSIQLERRSPTYKLVVITPASVIVLLIMVAFWLPAASGEKIFLNGIVAVIITMFMLYFAQQLPVMAFHTPLVVKFYASSLMLVAYSIIISTIVIACARSQHAFAVPWMFKKLIDGPVGKVLLLSHLKVPPSITHRGEEMRENTAFDDTHTAEDRSIIQGSLMKTANQQDWVMLGTAIDRLAFVIYAFVFIIMAIVYSV